jgi:phosphatidylglycerophosphate synthase
MATSTDTTPAVPLGRAEKDRPARELVIAYGFGPLAALLVRALLPLRIAPPTVVLAHFFVGLAAAALLGVGALAAAAVLLQVKTLLDNADGLLARASGRVTLVGRYLDTEADLVVNAAVFVALAFATDAPWPALAGFLASVLLLGLDFNLSELHREVRGRPTQPPARSGRGAERVLEGAYRVVFAPQDRLVRAFSRRRLERALGGEADPDRVRQATLAYHDRFTMTYLANTGLSTQLAVLGACLLLGAPAVFLWLVVASALPLPLLQLRRERLARRALHRAA